MAGCCVFSSVANCAWDKPALSLSFVTEKAGFVSSSPAILSRARCRAATFLGSALILSRRERAVPFSMGSAETVKVGKSIGTIAAASNMK